MTSPVREAFAAVRRARIGALPAERRIGAIMAAARELTTLGTADLDTLAASSGLSPQMVCWALATTFESVTETRLTSMLDAALAAGAPATAGGVILSANILTAPARALLTPILLGVPVVARASARDHAFAHRLRAALHSADPELAEGLHVMQWPAEEVEATRAMLDEAAVTHVYGSDATMRTLTDLAELSAGPLVLHGHGYGAVWLGREVVSEGLEDTARAVALDVAAYDQRGCLSPQVIYLDAPPNTADADGIAWCEALAGALAREQRSRPRGPMPEETAAASLQWRGVAAACGQLFEGEGFAVAYEGRATPRTSPGYRHIAVHLAGEGGLAALARLGGPHLKRVGVTPGVPLGRPSASASGVTVVPVGQMQRPRFDWDPDAPGPSFGWLTTD